MVDTLKMAEVYAICALLERGWSQRRIAQALQIDRETVRRYARLARATAPGGVPAGAPLGCGPPKPATAPPVSEPDGSGVYERELGSNPASDAPSGSAPDGTGVCELAPHADPAGEAPPGSAASGAAAPDPPGPAPCTQSRCATFRPARGSRRWIVSQCPVPRDCSACGWGMCTCLPEFGGARYYDLVRLQIEREPMDVYLVQHGEAVSEERDPQRPLSETGRAAVAKLASYLATRGRSLIDPPIVELRHSGKQRARQTAEIFARAICPQVRPLAVEGLHPKGDPRPIQTEFESRRDQSTALMLVGHLPHLARLASLLLTDDAEKSPVRFANAAVLRLGFRGGSWAVDWYVTPACVP